ncbi:hypothetical protein NP493_346g02040 [Ridgeia piscesae]|uniref:Uncharacterized protein n=1 Tax=Ridgeia piscesae TaxID=27915 RepID=A0AAD9NW91_RIDPI|nr:hypothetical protein NP493_346g02040 [Ridgeia piscesae]
MKVIVLFNVVCIFALVLPQTSAENEYSGTQVVRRAGKAPVMCAAKCQYNPCMKMCMHCAFCYCNSHVYGQCKCCN